MSKRFNKASEGVDTNKAYGVEEAVKLVSRAIKRSRAGLGQPDRPAGCFLCTGPTGVGKTELAKQLARLLAGKIQVQEALRGVVADVARRDHGQLQVG